MEALSHLISRQKNESKKKNVHFLNTFDNGKMGINKKIDEQSSPSPAFLEYG